MRYAIAAEGTQVAAHFGRCPEYLLVDIEDGKVTGRTVLVNPGHEPGLLPRLLAQNGVEVVVAGGAGPRAIGLLAEMGITACLGASGPIQAAVAALQAGTLQSGESACEHNA